MPCVCGTPLGMPVEPEVNRYLATVDVADGIADLGDVGGGFGGCHIGEPQRAFAAIDGDEDRGRAQLLRRVSKGASELGR